MRDQELGNPQHMTSVVHEAASALVPRFSVQIAAESLYTMMPVRLRT